MSKVVSRFLSYISVDTAADPKSGKNPSSASQYEFALRLADELKTIGLIDIEVSSKSYLTATLPANTTRKLPVVGFVAHLDTSPDFCGKGVSPQIVENYNGNDIVLNKSKNIVLSPSEFPELQKYIGQTLITTDGNTLLGADDKAGVAEIVSAMEVLFNSTQEHGKVRICFTPDEEIGQGADYFDVASFGADFAYTLDGDELGVIEYENFNAAVAKISISGKSVHPGSAKNKMRNAVLVAQRLLNMLPASEVPEKTEGYEGFFHVLEINGNVASANIEIIIRDHDHDKFQHRKQLLQSVVQQINIEYGGNVINCTITDQYYNMLEKIKPVMHVVERAQKAMVDCGITPVIKAIRGGTDGARLSYMGLPCPNIFAGGLNFHGPYEFIPVKSMEKAVEVIVKIVQNIVKE